MQPESFPPGFVAAPYADRFIQSQPLFGLLDFLPAGLQISRPNGDLPNLRCLPVTEPKFPFLTAQFECEIQNSCAILFFRGCLVFHFSSSKVRCLFEVAKPPSLFRAKTYIGSTVRPFPSPGFSVACRSRFD